jgi:hypothetical protein
MFIILLLELDTFSLKKQFAMIPFYAEHFKPSFNSGVYPFFTFCHSSFKFQRVLSPDLLTPEQSRRLAQLDPILAEKIVTQEEYAAKRREILVEG